jgi:SAM-dependent methyltransferase
MPDWETSAEALSIAENYARYLVPAFFDSLAAETLKHAQARPGDTVLDAACGTGVVTFELAPLVGQLGRVVGVDLDRVMVSIAERIRKARGATNVRFYEMNAQKLEFVDGTFDRVACQHGIMFFDDKPAAVKEMYRVLAPGGRLVITAWSTRTSTPHESLLAEAFHARLEEEPPFFRILFSVGDRGAMEEVLRIAGVKPHSIIERVRHMAIFPSAQAYWQGMVHGRPIARLAAALPKDTLEEIKTDVFTRMSPYAADKGFISPMEAVVATVIKP